jgi:hypothetical protein
VLDSELSIQRAKLVIEAIALIGLVIGGVFTYLTYRQAAELQGLRAVNEAKLSTCQALVATTAKFYSAESTKELRKHFYEFSELKHGQALTLLDPTVLSQATRVHNAAGDALMLADGDDFRHRSRCVLKDEPMKLSLTCRSMLAEALKNEAGLPIPPIDPSFVMGWTQGCEAK